MFNWLKRKKKTKVSFPNWQVQSDGFDMIDNETSIQYVNADGTRVVYVSVLLVEGGGSISSSTLGPPTIVEDENGWNLKGTKIAGREVLVCVISFKDAEDSAWARFFFDSIVPVST
jgi:hypothetical protein